jgi:hypothetical protein
MSLSSNEPVLVLEIIESSGSVPESSDRERKHGDCYFKQLYVSAA